MNAQDTPAQPPRPPTPQRPAPNGRTGSATPAVRDKQDLPLVGAPSMGELVAFDYAARSNHLRWE